MILLVRNTKGLSLFNQVFYFLIRLFIKSRYNHVVLLKKVHGIWLVYESNLKGFNCSKTLEQFIKEQNKYKRELLPISLDNFDYLRFTSLLGNNYNARYWNYLMNKRGKLKPTEATNCFQSIGYIFNIPQWWKTRPQDLISYNTDKFDIHEKNIIKRLGKT
jgi:hypothetical protein